MENSFKSAALEANLAQTKRGWADLPERHRWFAGLSASYWGIHKRAEEFINELNHPYPDYDYIVETLHTISLTDLWLYSSIEESEAALLFLVGIIGDLFGRELPERLREHLVKTLFSFIDKLIKSGSYPDEVIRQALKLIEEGMAAHELIFMRNTGHFKFYLAKAAVVPGFSAAVCALTKNILNKSCLYWTETTGAEAWFAARKDLFQPHYREKIKLIGRDFFAGLAERIEASQSWAELASNLFFNDIANHFRYFSETFSLSTEKIYYLIYLLHLPGMVRLKKHLLYDLNSLLKSALSELEGKAIYQFVDMLFSLFRELKEQQTGIVLDCLYTLGKEIAATGDEKIIARYTQKLIEFGFVYPGEIEITGDWETKVNTNHVKNIRIWLDLIKISPYSYKNLLSALVVNLNLGGIFISDTDLFQRDVTSLLNADIGPVYRQVKQLARFFPVYFSEIGAEGRLRDVSTAMDELAMRKDKLVHFVRKQIHAESNNMHIELVQQVAAYWFSGDPAPLRALLPGDVSASLNTVSGLFTGVHGLMRQACEHFGVDHAGLLQLSEDEVVAYLRTAAAELERDRKRLICLVQLNSLLLEKYTFETRDVAGLLLRSHFFSEKDTGRLQQLLEEERYCEAVEYVFELMGRLKKVILDKAVTEPTETIYYKRHVAIGIPSMYGQYRETKFEALGLMYRLEQLASRLMEKVLERINFEYISAKTLNSIYEALVLFKMGLELMGMVNQNFNSTLEMFRYSLNSTSVTLGQYMNIFRFMAQHIKELINEYFIRVYDETINVVIPQIFDESKETVARESEKFYREILSSTFLIRELDRLIADSLDLANSMLENYSEAHIHNMMAFNPDLVISPLNRETLEMDNPVFLGAKAYYLKKLIHYGLPVPPGFVLTTEVYRHRDTIWQHANMNLELDKLIREHLAGIEAAARLEYGNTRRPMLLSVRSGTAISMPGAMSTFLNIGMNDKLAEALGRKPETAWMGWDCYRRFIQSWGMSHGVNRDYFDEIMARFKLKYGVDRKLNFSAAQMRELALEYKKTLNEHDVFIVENPFEQLKQAIGNIFDSWSAERAVAYRKHLQIADEWGTAVIVQKMVTGNRSRESGSGVVFTHNPKLKKPGINLYGDFTLCSQGEDIVAGLVYPLPISESQREDDYPDCEMSLETAFPLIYQRLQAIAVELIEQHGYNNQEIEFTFESSRPEDLYVLQIREQNIIQMERVGVFSSPAGEMKPVGKGIGAGGGCMSGIVAFSMEDLISNQKEHPGEQQILIRPDTVPDDIQMIFLCDGLVTSRGGVTSHAAVAAEKLGKVCVVNCKELVVDEAGQRCLINGHGVKKGDSLSIDGKLGHIFAGSYPVEFVYPR